MSYYKCARCGYISKQKIDMKRHLDKKVKCNIINNENEILNEELLNSIRKIIKEITANPQESRREWLLQAFKKAGAVSGQKQKYKFWQHSNHPEELYSDKFINQKERYILMNSIEMGMVSKPEHYRLSSACEESPLKVLPLR